MNDPRRLAIEDGRYSPEAFQFLFEALDHAVQFCGRADEDGPARHISGQELLEGMRDYAAKLFGPLAAHVWRSWGVRSSLDWGRIVFLLVEKNLLKRQESDSIDDFRDGFDFDEAFVRSYRLALPPEIGIRPVDADD